MYDFIHSVLGYDPETGVFTWLKTTSSKAVAGTQAGSISDAGYCLIGINRRVYRAHRLAWLYVHGVWPSKKIDHINGNRLDNRLANLRDVSVQVNNQNCARARSDSHTGIKGVSFEKARNRYRAFITVNGKTKALGIFKDAESASRRYLEAKQALHEGFVQ